MIFNRKKIVAFDFDGTILDSMEEFADIAARVMQKFFGSDFAQARQHYLATSGLPFFQQLDVIYPGNALNASAAAEFEGQKSKTYVAKSPFPDVWPALRLLRQNRIRTVVSSNNFQDLVENQVAATRLPFDLVLGFRDGFAKGADHFHYIMSHFDCMPRDILFVGDSLKDMERARSNHIDFVGRTGTFSRADFIGADREVVVVDQLLELCQVLDMAVPDPSLPFSRSQDRRPPATTDRDS